MEDHKTLFKAQTSVLSPRNHNQINRERQRVARTKKREECFQSNRNMDVSPTPTPASTPLKDLQLEEPPQQTTSHGEQENLKPLTANKSTFEGRKESYLQRYIKWKTENRKRAPVRAQKVDNQQPAAAAVYVPPNRRSMYVVIDSKTINAPKEVPISLANPPAKRKEAGVAVKLAKQAPGVSVKQLPRVATGAAMKPLLGAAVKSTIPPVVKSSVVAATKPSTRTTNKPLVGAAIKPKTTTLTVKKPPTAATGAMSLQKIPTTAKKPWQTSTVPRSTPLAVPVTAAGTTSATAGKPKPVVSIKKPLAGARINKPANLMTQPFDKPNGPKIVKPLRAGTGAGGGVAAKFKTAGPHKSTKSQGTSNLSRSMKIKKAAPSKQKLVDKIPNYKNELLKIVTEDPQPDTPLDQVNVENPFQAQATSTQCKSLNSSQNLLEAYKDLTKISPVSVTDNPKNDHSSVKRQLIPGMISKEKSANKFNFVRYSEGHALLESPNAADEPDTVIPAAMHEDTVVTKETEQSTVIAAKAEEQPQTPTQSSNGKPNYLSPFVSVSRGKVNSHTERKKRDSMYLQDEDTQQPEMSITVRRTLDAVQYFRLQLSNEIERLQSICVEWSSYCDQHEDLLMESGGKDMIDAAIGQTKLLTSKKMQQFSSLIDRCEAGATGVGLRPNDGSESTKPVLPDDLEGWWAMMRLQSDNVDKRFENLTRWKANNWQDPDEVPKPAKIKAKVPKAKKKQPVVKPSSNLMSFMRKAKAEKKRAMAEEAQMELTATPTRKVIVVRDRKSFSPARTVLRLSMGSGGRPSMSGNGLLKSAIMAAAEQKSRQPATPPPEPPRMISGRMSILKTPGTAKKREPGTRGVLFSAKKNVRRFEFAVEEGNISGDDDIIGMDKLEDCEEDMSMEKSSSLSHNSLQSIHSANPQTPEDPMVLRTCQLRNRRVKIRPSSEFM